MTFALKPLSLMLLCIILGSAIGIYLNPSLTKSILENQLQLVAKQKYDQLYQEYLTVSNDKNEIQNSWYDINKKYQQKTYECNDTQNKLTSCESEVDSLKTNVLFKGSKATINFKLLDGNTYYQIYDAQMMNSFIIEGELNRLIIKNYNDGYDTRILSNYFGQERMNRFLYNYEIQPIMALRSNQGTDIYVQNYLAFKDTESMRPLSNYIQQKSKTNKEFLKNLLYVKSQINTYSFNLIGQPRYPLETFLEGGGDCGASVILIGSMIKATHPGWKVQLWAVNSNSISNPGTEVNHAILYVDNGEDIKLFIETTSNNPDNAMNYYNGKEVSGWAFDL